MATSVVVKYLSLSFLIVQYVCHVLVARYSRKGSGEPYLPTTVVAISEIWKLAFCGVMIFWEHGFSISSTLKTFVQMITNFRETMMLSIPAIIYSLQNNLLFVAISNLDAATYQVTYQLKIITTAMFSVFMLKKKIVLRQWLSLALLMFGIAMVQMSKFKEKSSDSSDKESNLIGICAILAASCTSGFAGVYFEKVVKTTPKSLWHRSFQLTLTGLVVSFIGVYIVDGEAIRKHPDGFFQGYNQWTWAVILLQTLSGVLVAVVVKYADNILKGFAISCSIIISSIVSYTVFGEFVPTITFILGTVLVVFASFLYGVEITLPSFSKTDS